MAASIISKSLRHGVKCLDGIRHHSIGYTVNFVIMPNFMGQVKKPAPHRKNRKIGITCYEQYLSLVDRDLIPVLSREVDYRVLVSG